MGLISSSLVEHETYGYMVEKIYEGSPAFISGLQSYFDFIVKINDVLMTDDPDSILKTLENSNENILKLLVYSRKYRSHRSVTVTKNPQWGGQGILGANLKYTNIYEEETNVWHVLEVYYGSPADVAGLRPYSDFILSSDTTLCSEEDFYDLIQQNVGKPIKLVVYNSETDAVRDVVAVPSFDWKSSSSIDNKQYPLGCGIGYGILHRPPIISAESGQPTQPNHSTNSNPAKAPPNNTETLNVSTNPNQQPTFTNIENHEQPVETYPEQQAIYSTVYPPINQAYSQQYNSTSQQNLNNSNPALCSHNVIPNPYHQYSYPPLDYNTQQQYIDLNQRPYN